MIKLYEITKHSGVFDFVSYALDDSEVRSDDSVTEGYFLTPAELEQIARDSWNRARMGRVTYTEDTLYGHKFESFNDYWQTQTKKGE